MKYEKSIILHTLFTLIYKNGTRFFLKEHKAENRRE